MVTVWNRDFTKSDRLPVELVNYLDSQGIIESAYKPNRRGNKVKPVYVVLETISDIRDLSCQMGPYLIEGNAAGYEYHRAIVREWGKSRLRFA